MTSLWPARFSDAHGTELTGFTADGDPRIRLQIRGFGFAGLPDDLRPVQPLPPNAPFSLSAGGGVSDYILEWRVPVLLDHASGTTEDGYLYFRLDEKEQEVAAVLRTEKAEYRSRWLQDRLDEALGDVRQQIPQDLRLRMCHSCGLAEYHDFAYMAFGDLACFRDTADEIRNHRGHLGGLWPRLTQFVSETHLCPQFEAGGYRGTVGEGKPNLWTAEDWTTTEWPT